ncbi:MAG TPA: hypothetical protein GX506_02405 [Firmicutes bacterium]|nr:hypothetical protein [Bacillota bacterium]
MFIKRTKAKSGGRTYTYIQLVESVWKDGQPRHRVVANLGRDDRLDPGEVERLIASLAPYGKTGYQDLRIWRSCRQGSTARCMCSGISGRALGVTNCFVNFGLPATTWVRRTSRWARPP